MVTARLKGAIWTETNSTYVVSGETTGAALLPECAALELDAQCQPLAPLPAGCAGEHEDWQRTFEVGAEGDPVEVPAGSFDAMMVSNSDNARVKTFWWVRGVGKIREKSNESVEELMDYCVPSKDPGCENERPLFEDLDAACP